MRMMWVDYQVKWYIELKDVLSGSVPIQGLRIDDDSNVYEPALYELLKERNGVE